MASWASFSILAIRPAWTYSRPPPNVNAFRVGSLTTRTRYGNGRGFATATSFWTIPVR